MSDKQAEVAVDENKLIIDTTILGGEVVYEAAAE